MADSCDIDSGASQDHNGNNIPDDCDVVWHVDATATGYNTGIDWNNAFTDLQNALTEASLGDRIWIAAGTYTPGPPGASRESTFDLTSGVRIYGGFAGWETSLQQRDHASNVTVLSGDLNNDDDYDARSGWGGDCCASHETPGCSDAECQHAVCDSDPYCCEFGWDYSCTDLAWTICCKLCGDNITRCDNAYHVVTALGTHRSTVLDGFTITDGNANAYFGHNVGGGLVNGDSSHLSLKNCTFTHNAANRGAAIYNTSRSRPTLSDCTFLENRARSSGGAMYNFYESDALLINCMFIGNSGGGMNNRLSNPTLTNCTFAGNTAYLGGGIYNDSSNPTLTDCMLNGNSAENGGGMYSVDSTLTLTNCLFAGNIAATSGGGLYSGDVALTATNCTFTANSASNGNGIARDSYQQNSPGIIDLTNSILWNGGDEVWNNDGSTITVTHSTVQDYDPDDGAVFPGLGNIDDGPIFVPGPGGCYYLSQIAAGQTVDSPGLDTGSDTAANLGLDAVTTRSDEAVDTDIVDMGYHYPITGEPLIMGDFDRSGDVNLADLAGLQNCYTGEGPASVSPCCRIFDFDPPDEDVDLDDYSRFARSFE